MGLLDLFYRWKCASCGKRYRSEPTECKRCGHTVYDRIE